MPLNYDGPPPALTPDEDIYNSRSPYPARAYSDESVQNKGPYTILILALNPISYIPAKGEISYFGSFRLTVRLATGTRTLSGSLRRKPMAADEEFVSRKVENPEDLLSYAGTEEEHTPSRSGGALADYPHVIITSQDLENASGAYTFQDLVAHRTANGTASTIVTTEYIYANFDGTRPDGGYNPYDPESNPGGTDTDASNPDSDGDGFSDLLESCSGSDPLNASGTPEMINVSFQPPSSTPPDGFAPDKGNSFSACGFGWQ